METKDDILINTFSQENNVPTRISQTMIAHGVDMNGACVISRAMAILFIQQAQRGKKNTHDFIDFINNTFKCHSDQPKQ